MILPPIIPNENLRAEELYKFDILDTPYEEEYDDIVRLASNICNTSISTITLIESSRQWFKAKVGLEDRETSRDVSFCAHAIASKTDIFEIEDATKTEAFFDNPLVTGNPNIRFYAGVPLVTSNGYKLGTLCVIDTKPKLLTPDQIFALKVLGVQVMKLLELRIAYKQVEQKRIVQQQQIEMLNKVIAVIAHDVRSPVASLKTVVELANSEVLSNEEVKELTVMSEKQLDGTLELLNDLLEWGHVQLVAQKEEEAALVNLYEIVEDKHRKFETTLSIKGNTLVNAIDKNFELKCNEGVIRFILRNLISNANKFTLNGLITVSAVVENKINIIKVADTGVGMTEAVINKILATDNKYTSLGTNNEKGTGLGIMLIKDFVSKMNGEINFESGLQKGTTAIIKIPQFIS